MDMELKVKKLASMLENYLAGDVSSNKLSAFVWNIISYFSDSAKDDLPPKLPDEGVFWNAIWKIQHLADEEHFGDTSCRSELIDTLKYLKGEKELPPQYWGKRP